MENAWEPMKNRNSWVFKERLEKKFGTMAHMKGKKRKGPQLIDGRILVREDSRDHIIHFQPLLVITYL